MTRSRLLLAVVLLALLGAFVALDLGRFLSLDYLRGQLDAFRDFREARPGTTVAAYMAVYIAATALSIPGAAVLTLLGGALFGLLWGTVIVSFASTIGATLAFLVGRFLFRDAVQRRFGGALETLNEGIRRDGPLYVFMVRLVPIFPFFVVNLALAVTPIRVIPYALASQLGMLPGTAVYVNAGTQLARIDSLGGILSPPVLLAFALLGVFPLVATWIARGVKRRRVLRGWTKPKRFDRNLVVIGAGSAGLVTAYIAAAVKARVSLIEKGEMGGDCLNTGCIPSKTLIRTAHFAHDVARHRDLGAASASASFDMGEVMDRVHRVVDAIAPHDSVERYRGLGVDVIQGEARITGPWSVEVGGQTLTTRNIVVATGARPFVPPIPGIEDTGYLTSDTLWKLRENPGRLLVLGGGPIGCELSQAFQRLGAQVTVLEMAPRILSGEDAEVSDFLAGRLRAEGVTLHTGWKAVRFLREGGGEGAAQGTDSAAGWVAVAEPGPGVGSGASGEGGEANGAGPDPAAGAGVGPGAGPGPGSGPEPGSGSGPEPGAGPGGVTPGEDAAGGTPAARGAGAEAAELSGVAAGTDTATGRTLRIPFDTLLVAVGRRARVEGFGLEEVGVTLTDDGRIQVDEYLESRVPTIYACGDCVGPYQFTHAASHQAWYAAVNSLFRNPFKRFKVDYRALPHATYTDPEVARVGLSEAEAKRKGVAYRLTCHDMSGQDRALAEEAAVGFVRVLTVPGKDRILGATVVGPQAGELIAEFTLAMKHGIGLNKLLGTIHAYPTLMEANKAVAGAWKRETKPEGLLRWVERWHGWRRG